MTCTNFVSLKALVLAPHPCQEPLIDIPEQRIQRRGGIPSVISYPTPKERIDLTCDFLQRQLCLAQQVQVPYRRPHVFQRRAADRRVEPPEQLAIPGPSHQSGPKAVPEEVELCIRILVLALSVLAVDDLGFSRMQLEPALCQARLELKQFRAVATRYDKTGRNFLAAIYLAAAIIWLN